MNDTSLRALVKELGAEPPRPIAALGAQELDRLTAALGEARRLQRQQIEQAMEGALHHVPALLRGAVRKIFYS
ncbi:MAG: hypothetical protein P4L83_14440 [Nevskia sp.]|nr:hypothetical protein [Nevskia sp.]